MVSDRDSPGPELLLFGAGGYAVQNHVQVAKQWLHGQRNQNNCYILHSKLSIYDSGFFGGN